ncbi:hypothetical protein B7463_g7177, partial [Scytalidium lignicola]
MALRNLDYSIYLVTDSTPAILGSRDLVDVVEAALRGGVTIVQYRDKTSDTAKLVSTARKLHAITKKYGVPLLINDRVDVALAVECEGVHIGQDDLDLSIARKLLGNNAIIGVTVSTIDEAQAACKGGADYLGIGTIKTNTKDIIGTAGTKAILRATAVWSQVRTVAIGGINAATVQRVLFQTFDPSRHLDGVAIVSAIIGAEDPTKAAEELKSLIQKPPPFAAAALENKEKIREPKLLIERVPSVVKALAERNPLSHNMTNLVVQNFAANVALAIGASPIMANYGDEAADLSKFGGALVINMGTVTPEGLKNYTQAIRAYNLQGGPIVLDPVGAGATAIRRSAMKTLMASGYFDLIKGNESEIKTVFGKTEIQQHGVDSGSSTLNDLEKAKLVRDLAARERCVALMTGATDFVSDGERTFSISNGHELLGRITGSGCVLGTTLSAMMVVCNSDKLLAAIAGLLHFEIAGEIAATRTDIKGPGSFVPALIDELICDVQERFRKAIWEYDKVINTTQKMIKASNILNIPIYATTQNRDRLGETCSELSIPNAVVHADKTAFSMWVPSIAEHFSSATPSEVVIVGIESHICVTQTTLDLLANGHKVYVLADGVSSCNPQEIPIALARLRAAGAVVTTSESFLYECMGDASIPEFKAIAGLVKETSETTKNTLTLVK